MVLVQVLWFYSHYYPWFSSQVLEISWSQYMWQQEKQQPDFWRFTCSFCVIFYLLWCNTGRAPGADFTAHVLYQEPIKVDCNSKWIYCNPARHQQYSSKLVKHEKFKKKRKNIIIFYYLVFPHVYYFIFKRCRDEEQSQNSLPSPMTVMGQAKGSRTDF